MRVLSIRDAILGVTGMHETLQLVAVHAGLALAALKMQNGRGQGLEDLLAARRQEATNLAEGSP